MANRLQHEKSPYLLQHKENPVDWHPWGEEAFELAKKKNRPIFLSIGYATCHWCHVMAHESFEDPDVAVLMNRCFINIKVDREERPDIDHTYMRVSQMLTGQGGWPLNLVLTPDKRPFFAATYIPRENRFNRPGMLELIPRIETAWNEEREKVNRTADTLTAGFLRTLKNPVSGQPGRNTISLAVKRMEGQFDEEWGGFGQSPKFPSPHNLTFLAAISRHTSPQRIMQMVTRTLEKMRLGGLFDQIGFGFHRYSTDSRWLVPHFEKMLYDQALLITAYAEGWRITDDPLFSQTALEIVAYVDERLTSVEGGFYSAEDADSEGEEGVFYQWTSDQVRNELSSSEAELVIDVFNLSENGNFHDEATRKKTGRNICWLRDRLSALASSLGMDADHLENRINNSRTRLKAVRDDRPRPLLDDKILTDWNGLMIAALARTGALLDQKSLINKATKTWQWIDRTMVRKGGLLYHRYRDGEAAIDGMADDYIFLQRGALDLYLATFDVYYLSRALKLQQITDQLFADDEDGGYFFTAEQADPLLGRQKLIHDGAIPSSNSVAAMNLIQLGRLTGDTVFEQQAEQIFNTFSNHLEQFPEGSTYALQALDMAVNSSAEVVIAVETPDNTTEKMVQLVRKQLREPHVILLKTGANQKELEKLAPFTTPMSLKKSPAVWICRNFHCEQPILSVEELESALNVQSGDQ